MTEQDWKKLLNNFFIPEFGSLWSIPNRFWDNGFATNRNKEGFHPGVIEKVTSNNSIFHIVPGTTKDYNIGTCVFKTKLEEKTAVISYFLIKLSIPCVKEKLLTFDRGWNGIDVLNEKQIEDFKMQIKFCRG